MYQKPTKALMADLQRFVFRHEIFVEAKEFDDGFLFTRARKGRPKALGIRRNFRVSLRCETRRVHFYTLSSGVEEGGKLQVSIDLPEQVLVMPAEAAIEYEDCGRDAKRYGLYFPKDPDAGRALFGYVRSESRMLEKLLGDKRYKELLRLVRRHTRKPRKVRKTAKR
jgi:hypothetical protein